MDKEVLEVIKLVNEFSRLVQYMFYFFGVFALAVIWLFKVEFNRINDRKSFDAYVEAHKQEHKKLDDLKERTERDHEKERDILWKKIDEIQHTSTQTMVSVAKIEVQLGVNNNNPIKGSKEN